MPSCRVPPSRISVLTFSAMACSVGGIGMFGGLNSAVPGSLNQEIKRIGGHQRVAVHEWQITMHLADQRERFATASRALRCDLRQEVGGHVCVGAQAQQSRCFVGRWSGNELGDHIEATAQRVARDVRVVAAQIVLLHMFVAQPGAGFHVELQHFNVRWQLLPLDEAQVLQLRIVAEDPTGKRLDEPPLQVAATLRHAQ